MAGSRRLAVAWLAALAACAAAWGSADETLEQRRARIEHLTPEARRQLLEDLQRFQSLSPEEQDKLRRLHKDFQARPDREELGRVMKAYYDWVSDLPDFDRAELARLSPAERVAKVIELQRQQQQRGFRGRPGGFFSHGGFGGKAGLPNVSPEDLEAVRKWILRYAVERRGELAAALPPEAREKWEAKFEQALGESPDDEKSIWGMLIRWHLANPKHDLPLSDADLASLQAALSEPARRQLQSRPADQRRDIVQKWMRGAVAFHFFAHQREIPDLATPEQLANFFENELEPEKRDRVINRPNEESQWWLRFYYFQSKMPEFEWPYGDRTGRPFSRGGPGGPRQPGPGGPGPGGPAPSGPGPGRGADGARDPFGGPRPGDSGNRPGGPPPPRQFSP